MSARKAKSVKPGYRLVRFGDVVRQCKEKADPETSGLERYVAGDHMDTDDLRLRRWGEIGSGYLGPAFHIRFRPGQVLYGSRRTYLRKVAVADFEGICANTTFVLEPKNAEELLPEFLPFLMQSEGFNEFSVKNSKGSVNPYINFSDLGRFEFLLPPISEQLRIVTALTALDESRELFVDLQAHSNFLLKSLLDRMWDAFPKRTIGSLIEEGQIFPPQDGNHGEKHPKASDYVEEGIPFIMASDLKDGEVDLNNCKKIPEALAKALRIGFASPGDVLLSHKGTVGQVARLGSLATKYAMLTPQVTYYRTVSQSKMPSDWFYYSFQTPGFRRLLEQYGRQSTRAYVGITSQRELSIPFANPEEMKQTLSELLSVEKAGLAAARRAESVAEMRQRLLGLALA